MFTHLLTEERGHPSTDSGQALSRRRRSSCSTTEALEKPIRRFVKDATPACWQDAGFLLLPSGNCQRMREHRQG